MQSYLDIGFDENLSPDDRVKREYISGIHSDTFIEGVDASQMMSYGKFSSERGNWQIGYTDETIELPNLTVTNRNTQYAFRAYKATVATDGTGDYDNIQDAIDYVNRNGNGTVFIAAGTYTINYTITLYDNVRLVGEGIDTTILDFNDTTTNYIKIVGNSSADHIDNSVITDLTIKNCNTANGTIFIKWATNVLIDRVKFKDNRTSTTGIDIWAQESGLVVVQNCIAEGGATFFWAQDTGEGNLVFNNYINDYNNTIFVGSLSIILGAKHITFQKNWINDYSSAFVNGVFQYCHFVDNRASNKTGSSHTDVFTLSTGSTDNHLTGNYVEGSDSSDAVLEVDGSYNRFSNNAFFNFGAGYAAQIDGDRNIFTGNQFGDEPSTSVYVTGSINVFTGNIIGGDNKGIHVESTADATIIVGNYITASTDIDNDGTNTTSGNNG